MLLNEKQVRNIFGTAPKVSSEFYTDYQHLFHESPDYFCHFLKSDCSLFTEVLSERTNVKLESIQVENGLQFMKNFISHHLSTINECEFQEVLYFSLKNSSYPQ